MEHTLKILLIEDSKCDAKVIGSYIKSINDLTSEVKIAINLSDALTELSKSKFDIILSDLNLPDTKGLDSFKGLVDKYSDTPFILLTGTDSDIVLTEANKIGIQDYLVKSDLSAGILRRSIRYSMERMASDRKNKKLQRALIESQRLESLGKLSGGIAHDFNNKLGIIMLVAESLNANMKSNSDATAKIETIINTVKRSSRMMQQLLAFSRKQELRPELVDLSKLVLNMKPILEAIFGDSTDVVMIGGESATTVRLDPKQFEEALLNIALNSKDAMPHGGKFIVKIQSIQGALANSKLGGYVELSVNDSGVGMDKETLKHLFEPFYSTREMSRGLGLSTIHGLVKQTGGFIKVESKINEGTTFKIYWPEMEITDEVIEAEPSDSKTVLYAEDEEEIRKVIKLLLEAEGYEVIDAENGEEALDKFKSFNKKIDILLTDVVMPKMDGEQLANEMRSLVPDLRIIFTSGYTQEKLCLQASQERRLDEIIYKPFSFESLLDVINKV